MARLPRTVVAGLPHHVTQRGNRREAIFFEDGDQEVYRDLLAEKTRKAGVEVWAYCLIPNHVHLILTPTRADPDFVPRCTGQGCVCAFLCGKAHEDRGAIKLTGNSGGCRIFVRQSLG
jgi:REP element-mobilizing transposase RayT